MSLSYDVQSRGPSSGRKAGFHMAGSSETTSRVVGLALVVIGIGLAFWGYQMSGSIGSRITHTFTGSYSDDVMIRFIGGAASFVVGLYLLFRKGS